MGGLIYQASVSMMEDCNYYSLIEDSDNMADQAPKGNPAFFKGEFSFVNKDAKNIDSKDHNAAVSWHVMNRYERWKKQEQAKKLRASANVPVGPLSPPSLPQLVRGRPFTPEKARRLTLSQSPASIPTAPFGFDPWTADQPLQAGYSKLSSNLPSGPLAAASRASTPSTQSSTLDDPFSSIWNTSSTSLDLGATNEALDAPGLSPSPLIDSLIGFAYGFVTANSWPTEPGSVQGIYETAQSWEDITAMTQDKCFSDAYLGLLAVAMAQANDNESLLLHARQFQGHAMTELRRRVARNTSQDLLTLKAILKLFSAETIQDNTGVARVHLKMLRNLVTAGGGVILLDCWFREDLLSCDCYFSLKYGTRPTLPAQEWTPGPLSQPWKARLMSAGVLGDHAANIDPSIEHAVLKTIVTDLRELFKAHEYVAEHALPSDDQLLRWRQLRKLDCISRLADHYTNLTIYPHLYDRPHTQALTSIAAMLFTNMILGSPEPVRYGLKLLTILREKLRESQGEGNGDMQRLRLWVVYVASLAEKVHPVAESEAGFFGTNMKAMVRKLKLEDWEAMKQILRQFLFSETLQREIESGRAFRKADFIRGLYSASGISWRQPAPMEIGLATTEGGSKAAEK